MFTVLGHRRFRTARLGWIVACVAASGLTVRAQQSPPAPAPASPAPTAEPAVLPGSDKDKEEVTVFRSDVSLVRVDVQVLDREHRPIGGLQARDFVLRDEGRVCPIRSFAREDV